VRASASRPSPPCREPTAPHRAVGQSRGAEPWGRAVGLSGRVPTEPAAERAGLQRPPGSFALAQPLPLRAQLRLQHWRGGAALHGAVRPRRAAHDQVGTRSARPRCPALPPARPGARPAAPCSLSALVRASQGSPCPFIPHISEPRADPVQPGCPPARQEKRGSAFPQGCPLRSRRVCQQRAMCAAVSRGTARGSCCVGWCVLHAPWPFSVR